jgi:hypothetical protein
MLNNSEIINKSTCLDIIYNIFFNIKCRNIMNNKARITEEIVILALLLQLFSQFLFGN